jgi:NitT/TauT family transport system substrate-binding protein
MKAKALACAVLGLGAVLQLAASPLKVGILPDVDSLPLLVAKEEGLFAAQGIEVSLVSFKTAVERDAALQAGAIDGAVSDLLAVALSAQGGFDIKATSLTDGRYGLVASPQSRIDSLAGLADVPIGISSNTIIQYAAETMVAASGVAKERIRGLAVPKIQLRMELLLAGQLEAACLPEPLLSVARAKGARLIAASDDFASTLDQGTGFGAGVIVFSKSVLDNRLADVAAFYRGYALAASAIDAKSDSYRDFLVAKAGFPAEVRDSFSFVYYRKPRLPKPADVDSVLSWMRAKGLLAKELPSGAAIGEKDLVDGRALAEAAKGW